MEKFFVAVGSTRRPKLDAVREALAIIGPKLDGRAQFEIVSRDVPSGVGHTPLSQQETMAGARRRAEELVHIGRQTKESWQYFVGLEGGLNVMREQGIRLVFLENWAYVTDGNRRGAFGQSGAVSVPEPLARRVVDEGIELSEAIDEFTGGNGIRNLQGAWGVLTRDLVTRQEAFRIAVINAFAPFFNETLYRRE